MYEGEKKRNSTTRLITTLRFLPTMIPRAYSSSQEAFYDWIATRDRICLRLFQYTIGPQLFSCVFQFVRLGRKSHLENRRSFLSSLKTELGGKKKNKTTRRIR